MFFNRLKKIVSANRRIYLDFASSTPFDKVMHKRFPRLSREALDANPYALHKEGVAAKNALKEARAIVAKVLQAHPDEVVFTSGATESNNLALIGIIENWLKEGLSFSEIKIVTTELEHSTIFEILNSYRNKGMAVQVLSAQNGVVNPKEISVTEDLKKILICVMYVNNEIGTVQPIKEIAKRARYLEKHNDDLEVLFHTDATQAPAYFSLNVLQLGVDMLTLGSTKLYTTKGVGVLFKKRSVSLSSIMHGGGQEFGLRPGTEAVENIALFANALSFAQKIRQSETERVKELQTYFEYKIAELLPEAVITAQTSVRSPHISHVAIKGIESELLVLEMDAKGIAVSTKSACKNEDGSDSSIVQKIYGKDYGAIRFSFGRKTSKKQIDKAAEALFEVIKKYKRS